MFDRLVLSFYFTWIGYQRFFSEFAFRRLARRGTVAACRKTAANFSALFQITALCRDAATPMPPRAMMKGLSLVRTTSASSLNFLFRYKLRLRHERRPR